MHVLMFILIRSKPTTTLDRIVLVFLAEKNEKRSICKLADAFARQIIPFSDMVDNRYIEYLDVLMMPTRPSITHILATMKDGSKDI